MYLFHPNSGSVPATKARTHIVPMTHFIPCILLLKAPYINIKLHKSSDIEYRQKNCRDHLQFLPLVREYSTQDLSMFIAVMDHMTVMPETVPKKPYT